MNWFQMHKVKNTAYTILLNYHKINNPRSCPKNYNRINHVISTKGEI